MKEHSELILCDQHYPDTKIRQRYLTYKQNYRAVSLMNTYTKYFNKILSNFIQDYIKRPYTMIKWDLSQGCKDFSIFANKSL